jgi:hypothetical protein
VGAVVPQLPPPPLRVPDCSALISLWWCMLYATIKQHEAFRAPDSADNSCTTATRWEGYTKWPDRPRVGEPHVTCTVYNGYRVKRHGRGANSHPFQRRGWPRESRDSHTSTTYVQHSCAHPICTDQLTERLTAFRLTHLHISMRITPPVTSAPNTSCCKQQTILPQISNHTKHAEQDVVYCIDITMTSPSGFRSLQLNVT